METPENQTQPPALSAYIAVAVVEWFKRYGEKNEAGQPQADTAQSLVALAETAGELVARLPTREQRRLARASFEKRFRRAHTAMGR